MALISKGKEILVSDNFWIWVCSVLFTLLGIYTMAMLILKQLEEIAVEVLR